MDPLQLFGAYAAEFEETFKDDNWERLRDYFHPDVRYVVAGSPFDCDIQGRDAVFSGLKKALDGMDRRFDQRDITPKGAPLVDGNTVVLSADVHYQKAGLPGLSFSLSETAEYDDAGKIIRLQDDYDAGQDHVMQWLTNNGAAFDPSYE